ncbi:ATPase [Methylosinus sp. Sm6]|uniref:F0F1 ATP synthase subunit B family protein n=1 Tax=Methylosinus sp. Sm6 TaxID=2866948 RepID=UPI001C99BF89|nr:ATPase [Methylosinus sp. Sm6]MBY6243654.1 ATPase [Methylosinus sp. Sm6]
MANIVLAAAEEAAPHESPAHGATSHGATQGTVEHHGGGDFPPFDVNNFTPQLVWLALIFGMLYVLMSRVALPRIGSILSERESRIESDLSASRELQAKAQAAAAEHDETLRATKAQAQGIGRDAQQQAASETQARRSAQEADFAKKLAEADAQIAAAKAQALAHIEEIATEAAGSILEKLTGARIAAETLRGEFKTVKAS